MLQLLAEEPEGVAVDLEALREPKHVAQDTESRINATEDGL